MFFCSPSLLTEEPGLNFQSGKYEGFCFCDDVDVLTCVHKFLHWQPINMYGYHGRVWKNRQLPKHHRVFWWGWELPYLGFKGPGESVDWEQKSLAQWKPLLHLGQHVFGLVLGQSQRRWPVLPQPQQGWSGREEHLQWSLAIREQDISGCCWNSNGLVPGFRSLVTRIHL